MSFRLPYKHAEQHRQPSGVAVDDAQLLISEEFAHRGIVTLFSARRGSHGVCGACDPNQYVRPGRRL